MEFKFIKSIPFCNDTNSFKFCSSATDINQNLLLTLADLEQSAERVLRRVFFPCLPSAKELDALEQQFCADPFLLPGGGGTTFLNWGNSRGATPDALMSGWGSRAVALAGCNTISFPYEYENKTLTSLTYDDLADIVRSAFSLTNGKTGVLSISTNDTHGFLDPDTNLTSWEMTKGTYTLNNTISTTETPEGWKATGSHAQFPTSPLSPLPLLRVSSPVVYQELRKTEVSFPYVDQGIEQDEKFEVRVPPWNRAVKANMIPASTSSEKTNVSQYNAVGDAENFDKAVILSVSPASIYRRLGLYYKGVAKSPKAIPPTNTEIEDVLTGYASAYYGTVLFSELQANTFASRLVENGTVNENRITADGVVIHELEPPNYSSGGQTPLKTQSTGENWWKDTHLTPAMDALASLHEKDHTLCKKLCVPPCFPGEIPYRDSAKITTYAVIPDRSYWLDTEETKETEETEETTPISVVYRRSAVPYAAWVRGISLLSYAMLKRTYWTVNYVYAKATLSTETSYRFEGGYESNSVNQKWDRLSTYSNSCSIESLYQINPSSDDPRDPFFKLGRRSFTRDTAEETSSPKKPAIDNIGNDPLSVAACASSISYTSRNEVSETSSESDDLIQSNESFESISVYNKTTTSSLSGSITSLYFLPDRSDDGVVQKTGRYATYSYSDIVAIDDENTVKTASNGSIGTKVEPVSWRLIDSRLTPFIKTITVFGVFEFPQSSGVLIEESFDARTTKETWTQTTYFTNGIPGRPYITNKKKEENIPQDVTNQTIETPDAGLAVYSLGTAQISEGAVVCTPTADVIKLCADKFNSCVSSTSDAYKVRVDLGIAYRGIRTDISEEMSEETSTSTLVTQTDEVLPPTFTNDNRRKVTQEGTKTTEKSAYKTTKTSEDAVPWSMHCRSVFLVIDWDFDK